ncbi:MAG: permease prefix domain 1-containing protein [Treponema sp.]|jgi:MFS family permease|nr:permease prefix domain 1-containing protein [Treponema sp.]
MDAKADAAAYVDSLFEGYEQTTALAEFKEELLSNFRAKIDSMVRKGMDEKAAFDRAASELGDLSALADEISLIKRREVFEDRYLDIRHYMKPLRVLGYIVCGVALVSGLIIAFMVYLEENWMRTPPDFIEPVFPYFVRPAEYLAGVFGVLLPFLTVSAAGFTFLALTQETSARYPMSWKRALWYALAAAALCFGLLLFPLTFFGAGGKEGLIGALATLLPFALPAAGLLVFLGLTEKNRLKPWARERQADEVRQARGLFADRAAEARFGLLSGAVWIFAAALFFIVGFTAGFGFSWIVFIVAVGMECLLLALMGAKK